jgi:N-acetylmuramoyl-L-alanine amidase
MPNLAVSRNGAAPPGQPRSASEWLREAKSSAGREELVVGRKDRNETVRSEILRGVFEANQAGAAAGKMLGARRRPGKKAAARVLGLLGLVLLLGAPADRFSALPEAGVAQETGPGWTIDDAAKAELASASGESNPDYRRLLGTSGVRLSALFGLSVQTIVIDPGHGGRDPGAVGQGGTMEKDLTLDIALRLRERLSEGGKYRIVLTREDDSTLSLSRRVELTNSVTPDLFLSIHVNALPKREINLIETYYFGTPADDDTMWVAERENQDSDYNLEAFRDLVKKFGDTLKLQESIRLASSMQHSLYALLKNHDRKILNNGTKTAPFVVLLGVEAPAVLVEVSCISNRSEEEKLRSSAYRDQVALCLDQGIRRYLDQKRLHAKGDEAHEQKGDG